MLFNSIQFLCFFPIVALLYYVIPHRFRHLFLLAASYYFYMCWNPRYALLMATSTIITYASGILLGRCRENGGDQRRARLYVFISFALNLSILFFFKYFNFFTESVASLLSRVGVQMRPVRFDIVLPVGISFYTFQALSYTMDVYRGELPPERNLFKYALFVSFFPQLVAGPIERSKNLIHQIHEKHTFDGARVKSGLLLMLFGYFQKLVLADRLAVLVDTVYNNWQAYQGYEIAIATVCFAFQIYCDFASYSNIAIGAARVMGFSLMDNFDTPYFSESVSEFWRRWHISLSTWFRDYLYIPLGGNRKGKLRTYINIMIVFLVSGLWHGASWHFVVWGGRNGLFQVIGSMTMPLRDRLASAFHIDRKVFSHRLLKKIVTFALICLTWLFFRAESMSAALGTLQRMLRFNNPWIFVDGTLFELGLDQQEFTLLLVSLGILFFFSVCRYRKIDVIQRLEAQGLWFRWLVYFAGIFFILIFGKYGPTVDASAFLYFQF